MNKAKDIIQNAMILIQKGRAEDALLILEDAFIMSEFRESAYLRPICDIAVALKKYERIANNFFHYAVRSFEDHRFSECIEALLKGLMPDISESNMAIVNNPANNIKIGRIYHDIARNLPLIRHKAHANGKLRIGHLTSMLIDVTAPTKILKSFVKYHDLSDFDVVIYSCELHCEHRELLPSVVKTSRPSTKLGINVLKEIVAKDLKIVFAPTGKTYMECAIMLAGTIAEDGIDVLVIHANPANCMAGVIAGIKPARYMINFDHGAPIIMETLDLIGHHLKDSFNHWMPAIHNLSMKSSYIPISSDISIETPTDEEVQIRRKKIGLKIDDLVLITVGLRLKVMMSDMFLEVLSKCLQKNVNVHFVAVGSGNFSHHQDFFDKKGVLQQVHFVGGTADVGYYLSIADIYVNTFPFGGGVSIVEAMAYGLPVVTARYGDSQTEKVGAEHVKYNDLITGKDPEKYLDILNKLCEDVEYRKSCGKKLRKRYEENYSAEVMVKRWEDAIMDLVAHNESTFQV